MADTAGTADTADMAGTANTTGTANTADAAEPRTIDPATAPRCIIVGAGTNDVLPPQPGERDLLIAADGGLDFLYPHGYTPTIVIGDFDSARSRGYVELPPTSQAEQLLAQVLSPDQPLSGTTVIALPPEKADTDISAAIKIGWSRGHRFFDIYGALGGRIDHSLGNIGLLAALAKRGAIGVLHSADTDLTSFADGCLELGGDSPRGMVSVFAQTGTAEGVTISDLKYETDRATFSSSELGGVSNELIGRDATISVERGVLLVTYPAGSTVKAYHLSRPCPDSFGRVHTTVADNIHADFRKD